MSEVYLGNPNLKKANTAIEFTEDQNIDSDDSNIFAVVIQNLTTNTANEIYAAVQWRETR